MFFFRVFLRLSPKLLEIMSLLIEMTFSEDFATIVFDLTPILSFSKQFSPKEPLSLISISFSLMTAVPFLTI